MPISSSKGLAVSGQFYYTLSKNIQFYIYSGYASWDKYNVSFHENRSDIQKHESFNIFRLISFRNRFYLFYKVNHIL